MYIKILLVVLDRIRAFLSFLRFVCIKSLRYYIIKVVFFPVAKDEVDEVNEEDVSGGVCCGVGLTGRNSKLCNFSTIFVVYIKFSDEENFRS